MAIGEYVLFIDADDFISPDSLKKISKYICNNVDVVFLDGYKYFSDKCIKKIDMDFSTKKLVINDNRKLIHNISNMNKFPGSPCTKAVRLNFLRENSISFMEGIVLEDIDWNLQVITQANSFGYCEGKYYFYRQMREGSVTSTISALTIKSGIFIIDKWGNSNNKDILSILAYEYLILLGLAYKINDKKNVEMLYSKKWLLKYGGLKVKIASLVNKLFGIKFLSMMLYEYINLKDRRR